VVAVLVAVRLPLPVSSRAHDRQAIIDLRPDLVVANQEENRRLDVERLHAAGVPVWVAVIESLDDALLSMRRLFADVLHVGEPAWLRAVASEWGRSPPRPELRVVVPIWRDPWTRTFTGELLSRLGLINVFGTSVERYPRVEIEQLHAAGADLPCSPDEPYLFTADDGPEAFPGLRTVLVSGRDLTWNGPSLETARADVLTQIHGGGWVSGAV
jgi:hypothetical protein